MKKENSLLFIILIISIIAVIFSVRSIKTSKQTEKEIKKLSLSLMNFYDNFAALSNKICSLKPKLIAKNSAPKIPQDNRINDWLNLLDDDLGKMENLIDKTGLKDLATNETVSASLLKNMVEEYAQQKKQEDYKKTLMKLNEDFHNADNEKYDEKVAQLYEKAKFRFRGGNNEEREKAFKELTENYPDAYATGMIIAEKAIGSVFRNNIQDAEKYYQMLDENENFDDIVIDWGFKAKPTLQVSLANKYIQEGRYDDAKKIINELENNSEDEYIFSHTGRRAGTGWKPKNDIINSLKNKLK